VNVRRREVDVRMETLKEPLNAAVDVSAELRARRKHRYLHQVVRYLVLTDVIVLAVAGACALALTAHGESAHDAAIWLSSTVVASLAAFSFYRLYERDRGQIVVSTLDEWRDFLNALSLVCLLELTVALALPLHFLVPVSAADVALFWAGSLLLLPLGRAGLRHVAFPRLEMQQNTLIVGAGRVGQMVALKLLKHSEYNIRLVGFLDDEPHGLEPGLENIPVVGGEDALVDAIRQYRVSRVVLAFSRRPVEQLLDVIRSAGLQDVYLSVVPRYFEIMAANVAVADLEGIPVLELPAPRLSRAARASKRALDLALTIPGLLALAPVFVIVAVAIKLDSRGPVFFRQPRMGRDHEVFEIIKFRTMVDGAEGMRSGLLDANESTGPLFKIRSDPRVTRIGRWLRRLSLDELPQLLNVVKGEMSLVGPRPFVIYEDEKIDGWARRRLDLTPGITGLWQVLGRNDIEFEEMVKLDYIYVNNWSLWWDIKLLLRTAPVVFTRRGY
jgi:exopolysaccharide biosynthesis polyprenyl glycosylphosphotransferase